MDSISAMDVFVQVVETGSLVAAGRVLGISASAVGKSIARLEERIGVRLFHRSSRSLRVTPEGARFVERCRRILAEVAEAESDISETAAAPSGVLRISLPVARSPFHAILADFRVAYPAVDLEVDSSNRSIDLVREGYDVAIRSGALQDSALVARDLGTFRSLLVASPAYLRRRGTPVQVSDLARHDLLRLRLPNTGRLQPLGLLGTDSHDGGQDAEQAEVHATRVALVSNHLDLLVDFALAGHGIAYVADLLVRESLASGALVHVLAEQVGESIPLQLVWASSKYTPPRLRAFIDFVVARCLGSMADGPVRPGRTKPGARRRVSAT